MSLKTPITASFLLLSVSLFSTQLFAETAFSQTPQSLSLELARTDDFIQVNDQLVELSPSLLTLSHSVQWNEVWMLSSSIWKGNDDGQKSGHEQTRFEKESSGLSSILSYQLDEGSWDFGISLSQGDARVRADRASFRGTTTTAFNFKEKSQSTDFFISRNYVFDWQNIALFPSVSLGYQQSEINTTTDAEVNRIPVREKQSLDLNGIYLAPGLTLSYLHEGANDILWQPSLSLGWTETVSGEVLSNTNVELRSMRGAQLKSNQQSGSTKSGYGIYSVSLLMLLGDYYAELSYDQSFSTDFETRSAALQLGLEF